MTRIKDICFLLCLALMPLTLASQPTEPSQGRMPNFVILFADDLGYGDLSSYGHPSIRTPNLDAMAAQGQRWTDFYVASSVCSPSRGALLTGKQPNRSGLYGTRGRVLFPNQSGGISDENTTIAEALRELGYATGIVGKWHLGARTEHLPTRHGFDYWFGIPYSNDMDRLSGLDFEVYFSPKIEYWNVPLMQSRSTGEEYHDQILERPANQETLTRRFTQHAQEFIERHSDRPFFIFVPYTMPHTPLFAGQEFAGTSLAGRYGDVIEEIDWSVGEIRRSLEDAGVAEDTLVVFTSDNGPWLTMRTDRGSAGPLRDGKGTTFEGGIRVPGVMWWPGSIQPGVVRDIGSAMDLFPTLLALAGGTTDDILDGVDLSATLLRGELGKREVLAHYRAGELFALRKGPYKIHLITQGAYGLGPERTEHEIPLLYDLGADPGESWDLAAERPEILAEMIEAVREHQASMETRPSLFEQDQ